MGKVIDGTKVAPHGMFYMESEGGYGFERAVSSIAMDEHQPSCFALEEEKGEDWKGTGEMKRTINEVRPSL
jgi:hypothetical protein